MAQANAGATFIDCCASVPEAEEVETLHWMIDCIQSVTDLPIAVDSPSADVLTQAYKFCMMGRRWASSCSLVKPKCLQL